MDITLQIEIFADGPTRVIRLTDLKRHTKIESIPSSPVSDSMVLNTTDSIDQEFTVELEGLGISVIDSVQELVYISLGDIKCRYATSKITKSIELSFDSFQVRKIL